MHKKKHWILLANAGYARMMERIAPFGGLKEISTLTHSHKATQELGTDRPGRTFESSSSLRHAYEPHSDPHELQKEEFAKELSLVLQKGYKTNQFEELSIFSAPHMLGLLRQQLHKSALNAKIVKEHPKDITSFSLNEVQKYIDNCAQT